MSIILNFPERKFAIDIYVPENSLHNKMYDYMKQHLGLFVCWWVS